MTPVSSGQVVNDNVGTFQWKFYTFAVPPQGTHSVSVHMKTIGTGVSSPMILPQYARLILSRSNFNLVLI